jgi:hypothetical protein
MTKSRAMMDRRLKCCTTILVGRMGAHGCIKLGSANTGARAGVQVLTFDTCTAWAVPSSEGLRQNAIERHLGTLA